MQDSIVSGGVMTSVDLTSEVVPESIISSVDIPESIISSVDVPENILTQVIPSLDALILSSTNNIIREHTVLTTLHSNTSSSRYFQLYFDIFRDPLFSYISFENILRKQLQNYTLDFTNTDSIYSTLYDISSGIFQNISLLNLNSIEFASNRSVFNKISYRYSLLYPTTGTYHLMSNTESLFNNTFEEEYHKIKHNETIVRTQSLVKNSLVMDKVGMSKHYSELILKRLMGYITNGIEGARPKNYYKSTVLDGVISVNRSNLPSTQAESLHICISTGNISELRSYINLIQTEYGLDLTLIYFMIEFFIKDHTAEIEFVKTELLKVKPSNKTSPYMFSEGKNYDKTSCVRIDFDIYHYEMCNLIIPEHHTANVNAFIIICSEIAALLSSICPNGFLAVDSIIYNFKDGFRKWITEKELPDTILYASSEENITIRNERTILQLQYALEQLFRAEDVFKNNFRMIDATIDLLKQKYNHTTSTYIVDNCIFKWALLQFKSSEPYNYSEAFDNFMNVLKSNFENNNIFNFTAETYEQFKKQLRANHIKTAGNLLQHSTRNMNIYNRSVDEYVKMKTIEVLRVIFPVDVLRI